MSPPTACKHPVSGTVSPPSSGYFSPFPHGTGSLSVSVPPYSRIVRISTDTGLSPTMVQLSRCFSFLTNNHWPDPISLVTTKGVSVISFPPAN